MKPDLQLLLHSLDALRLGYGGYETAFDMEWKVKTFVNLILNYAFKGQGLRVDGELKYGIFGDKTRPDLQVISMTDKETSLYIIEVKKIFDRVKEDNSNSSYLNIKEGIPQNFKQMRHHCINYNQQKVLGLVTNYKEWIFTSYSMVEEIKHFI